MNIAAQIKNKNKKSNYVVNLSFDIPVKPQKLLMDRPISGQFTISKNSVHKSLKLNLGTVRTIVQPESRLLQRGDDVHVVYSSRDTKRATSKQGSRINQASTRHSRNLSCTNNTASKSPMRAINKANKNAKLIMNSTCIKKLPKQIMSTFQDDIMGYTNPSSELITTANTSTNKHSLRPTKIIQPLMTPPLHKAEKFQLYDIQLLSEIKKYEQQAQDRKKHLNYQYIKQKLLVQSSARKIQRAWRRYKTQKIINSYSSMTTIKLAHHANGQREQKIIFEKPKILNVKSCGFKNGKNEMKCNIKKSKDYSIQRQEQKQGEKSYSQKQQEKRKIKQQQIQKWQQLIKQIRKNKDIQKLLLKVQQKRNDIHLNEKQQKLNKDSQKLLINADAEKKKQQIKKTMAWFENRPIFQNKQVNEINQKQEKLKQQLQQQINTYQCPNQLQSKFNKVDKKQIQNSKNQSKSKKNRLQTFIDGFELMANITKKQTDKLKEKQNEKLNRFNEINKQVDNINRFLSTKQEVLIIKQQYSQEQKVNVAKQIQLQIILQFVLQAKGALKKRALQKKEKQQGICTNMESIKDYLQNLISYILQQDPETMLESFNTPSNPSPFQILKTLRTNKPFKPQEIKGKKPEVLNKQFFYHHWNYACDQIYFEKKHDDIQKQVARIQKLKEITRIYFEAIFDGFNECLQPYRIYGLNGQPYPWQTCVFAEPEINNVEQLKPLIKRAYRSLSEMAAIFCGIFAADKQPKLPKQVLGQIQEERMCIFLQHQMKAAQPHWKTFNRQKTEILYQVTSFLFGKLCSQAILQLQLINYGKKLAL